MKVAIIGSRELHVTDFSTYLPPDTTEIVSGGARGIDTCAHDYAIKHGIKFTEFLPDYAEYGKGAPHVRNDQIIEYSDMVLAFWNGKSRGTYSVIEKCRRLGKPITVYREKGNE